MTRRAVSLSLSLLGMLAAAPGCESTETVPWRLERPRVLAMRVELVGDEAHSIPAPADPIRLVGLVADPTADRTVERRYAFSACLADTGARAGVACADEPFATIEGDGALTFELTAPDTTGTVLLSGIVCTGGAPRRQDGLPPTCVDGDGAPVEGEETLFTFSVLDGIENAHPVLGGAPTLDGVMLGDSGGCLDGAPRVTPRGEGDEEPMILAWELGDQAREALGEGGHESLLISHLTTHGELDRYYSFVSSDASSAHFEVDYLAPEASEIPSGGLDVTMWFVVRDERGGVTWSRRTLCVAEEEEGG